MEMEKIKSNDMEDVLNHFESMVNKQKATNKLLTKIYAGVGAFSLIMLIIVSVHAVKIISPATAFDYIQVNGLQQIEKINASVKAAAPGFISSWLDTVAETMPEKFKQQSIVALTPVIDKFTTAFSQDLQNHLAALYQKEEIKSALNGTTDVKQEYQKLFTNINSAYTRQIADFYSDNVDAVHNLKKDLLHLKSSGNLTADEQHAKKIIGAWLALLDHKGATWSVGEKTKQK